MLFLKAKMCLGYQEMVKTLIALCLQTKGSTVRTKRVMDCSRKRQTNLVYFYLQILELSMDKCKFNKQNMKGNIAFIFSLYKAMNISYSLIHPKRQICNGLLQSIRFWVSVSQSRLQKAPKEPACLLDFLQG